MTNTAGDAGSASLPAINGRHLIRVTPNGKIATVSKSGTVSTDTTNGLPWAAWVDSPQSPGASGPGTFYYDGPPYNGQTSANAYANVLATATNDSRDVIIKCFDIEDSSHAGPLDPVTNSYPQDVRAGDGSIVTDSAVAPPSPPNQAGGSTSWTASPTLFAQATGFQNPTFAWSVSGEGSSSAGNSNSTVLSVNLPVSTTDKALNKQSTLQVNVTDSDGATAANTFGIRWHYPKENATLFASGQPFWQVAELHNPVPGYVNYDATGTVGYSSYADFFPAAISDIFSVGANGFPNAVNPVWAAFTAAVGLAASQTQPTSQPVSANFNQCWADSLSTGRPWPVDNSLMGQYQMIPLLLVQYQQQTWNYEQYGLKGYLGPGQEAFNHFTGTVHGAGEFTPITQKPPGS